MCDNGTSTPIAAWQVKRANFFTPYGFDRSFKARRHDSFILGYKTKEVSIPSAVIESIASLLSVRTVAP